MTPAQARYKMRKPRGIRRGPGGLRAGWYYIEEGGISVLAENLMAGETVQMLLTWKQIEQALAIKRCAGSASESRS